MTLRLTIFLFAVLTFLGCKDDTEARAAAQKKTFRKRKLPLTQLTMLGVSEAFNPKKNQRD